jgi:hypothetical protein
MTINRTTNYGLPKPELGTHTAAQLLIYNQYLDEADEDIKTALDAVAHLPVQVAAAEGTVDIITATFSPVIAALVNHIMVRVIAAGANTGAVTFAPDALAAKPVVRASNVALTVGNIPGDNYPMDLVYLSALDKWVLLNPVLAAATVTFASEAEARAGTVSNKCISPLTLKHGIPAGVVLPFGGTVLPTGFLWCTGGIVSQTTYADLYSAIAGVYNTGGEGAGNFRLPNLQQRFPMGKAPSGTGSTLGGTGGAIDHVHSLYVLSGGYYNHLKDSVTGACSIAADAVDGVAADTDADNPPFQVFNYIIKH